MRGHKLKVSTESLRAGSASTDEMLKGIRDELRAIRELLEAKRHV